MAGEEGPPCWPISSCSSDAAPAAIPDDEVFDLKLTAKLNAFNVLVCDQKANIADIRIQGKRIWNNARELKKNQLSSFPVTVLNSAIAVG